MRQPSQKKLQAKVDSFNGLYKVGDPVKVKLDSGEIKDTTVKHPASILGGHTAVGWFNDISGCYNLDSVIPSVKAVPA